MVAYEYYIKKLKLKPLIKEDFLTEFYSTEEQGISSSFVYYLLKGTGFFPFHKMTGLSTWQYCDGCPLYLYIVPPRGGLEVVKLGRDVCKKERFIYITQPNYWFAAKPQDEASYTLVTHCILPRYKNEADICGFYEDIFPLIPDHERIAKSLSCVKGKTDSYCFDGEFGYKS